ELAGDGVENRAVPLAGSDEPAPGGDGALIDTEIGVGDDKVLIQFELGAQAGAFRAGPLGAVEAEAAWLEFFKAGMAIGAGEVLGVEPLLATDDRDQEDAAAELEGGLH